ncbi:hypothetical protein SEMRO_3025_G342300.1 [Seminavis robusta]|uniref:Uncharacterized protein n=1 Tax=Seminavis robusta TaxID=568900 RepID=A0A9N8F3L9_9STRA|nr:hypothetical protein SEMRO_3025_G342300.1 [Seminavis robusta]|eukprot:Sro3025_g342300.1 n/a (334) ;mRNA; f:6201-7302
MANRAAGVLRWGNEERLKVSQYLEAGNIDPTRMNSATYFAHLKTLEAVWDRHSNKNFYQNVRRAVQAWQAEGTGGQRRNDQNAPPPPAQAPAREPEVGWATATNRSGARSYLTTAQPRHRRAFGSLSLGASSIMLRHVYTWREGIGRDVDPRGVIEASPNLKRCSVDILLPGPTNRDQIECSVMQPPSQKKVKIKYTPPNTFFSARRTAVRTAMRTGVPAAGIDIAANRMSAMTRVTAHEESLQALTMKERVHEFTIDLPFEVEPDFTTRDDWGALGRARGVQIGMYRHDDPRFVHHNQVVWILHLEMVSRERTVHTPSRPVDDFAECFGFAY